MIETVVQEAKRGRSARERLNLLREEIHHLLLQEMDRHGGFQTLCFQGGTALRILYRLDRFSEDLDFSLSAASGSPHALEPLMLSVERSLDAFGLSCERTPWKAVRAVQSCFFRFPGILHSVDPLFRREQKLAVKVEIDTRPPKGGMETVSPITGTYLYKVRHYDLPSLFAGKLHAILYRQYTKGRDLFDFLWYLGRQTPVNFLLLKNGMEQAEGFRVKLDLPELQERLKKKFLAVDFEQVRRDLEPFVADVRSLSLFEKDLFLGAIGRISGDIGLSSHEPQKPL